MLSTEAGTGKASVNKIEKEMSSKCMRTDHCLLGRNVLAKSLKSEATLMGM